MFIDFNLHWNGWAYSYTAMLISISTKCIVLAVVVMLYMLVFYNRAYRWATGRIQEMTVKPALLHDGTRLTVPAVLPVCRPQSDLPATCHLSDCVKNKDEQRDTCWTLNVSIVIAWATRQSCDLLLDLQTEIYAGV